MVIKCILQSPAQKYCLPYQYKNAHKAQTFIKAPVQMFDCQDLFFLNELKISLVKMSSQKIFSFNYQRIKEKKQIQIYIIILSVCI